MTGSLIGTIIAFIVYHLYFPSPFFSSNYETMAFPRKTHKDLEEEQLDEDDAEEQEDLLGEERV